MKRLSVSFGAVAVILALCHGPSVVLAASPPPDMEAALMEAAATVCSPPSGCPVTGFQRTEILPGIVHYSAILQNGPGIHETIGIHRVVRENRPGHPVKQVDRIFLQHGDIKNFIGMFLPALYSENVADDFGLAIYLAQNNVDVWGIDQAWNLVRQDLTDYSFMEDWGMQYQADALRSALAVAREVRYLQGGSGDRFNLLGYSSGSMTGFALLNYETQLPKKERHVQGYVAADMTYDSLDPDMSASSCNDIQLFGDVLNAGEYGYNFGFRTLGILAKTDPDGPSPVFIGFTNLQVALYLATAPLFGATPIHYLAGVFDETGFPTGMQYMTTPQWLDFMTSGFDWEPTQFVYDYSEVLCDQYDSPYDDYMAAIKIPVFNWGAAGGIAPYGTATLGLLGSKDISEYIVSTHPPEEIYVDFGHIDLFAAQIAPEVAWPALLDWIQTNK